MKKGIFLTLSMLAISFVQAQELFHKYDLELVKRFQNEKGEKNLMSRTFRGYAGNSKATFVYTEDGTMKIYDPMQNRIVVLGSDFDIAQSIPYHETSSVTQFGDWFVSFFYDYGFEIRKIDGTSVSKIPSIPNNFRTPKGIFLYKNYLFVHDQNAVLYAYRFKDGFIGPATLLNPEQTQSLFKKETGVDLGGLVLDEKNRLFLYGRLITQDIRTFKDYLREKKGGTRIGNARGLTADPFSFSDSSTSYLGRDVMGNWYWGGSGGAAVFNPAGNLIEYFINDREKYTVGQPYVSPNGDLFFLGRSEEWVSLYRLRNTWDHSFKVGILNDNDVRIRADPTTSAEILGKLDKGAQFAVTDQTKEMYTISGQTAPWVKVRMSDGREGWVFGAFVDIQN